MTPPIRPDQPWQLQHPPEKWQQILHQATQDFHRLARTPGADPSAKQAAMQAMHDANEALGVYDEAEAASPSERISSGFHGAIEGLGQAVEDIPRGMASSIMHPIETVKNLPNVPKDIWAGLTSDDPSQVARTVGNIGSMLIPGAKGKAGYVGSSMARGASAPFRAVGSFVERPGLKNSLLKSQIAESEARLGKSPLDMALLEARKAATEQSVEQKAALHPDVAKQAKLKTEQMGLNVNEKTGTLNDKIDQSHLKTTKLEQDVQRGEGSLEDTTDRPGLLNELTRLQIQKLQRLLDDMDSPPDEAGPSGSAPKSPKSPIEGAPTDILGDLGKQSNNGAKPPFKLDEPPPGGGPQSLGEAEWWEKFNKNPNPTPPDQLDPYGLNDVTPPKQPPKSKPPTNINDPLHDILSPKQRSSGPKPMSADEINRLLGGI